MRFSIDKIGKDLSDVDFSILELLSADNQDPIIGKTAFQKEMFLISNFIDDFKDKLNFIPHNFGPYSEAAESALNNLIALGLVKEEPSKNKKYNKYYITENGLKILHIFSHKLEEYKEAIADFKSFLNDMNSNERLLFIYVSSPEYTTESTILKKVFENRKEISKRLYENKKVSLEKAAQLADMNIEDFLDYMSEQ